MARCLHLAGLCCVAVLAVACDKVPLFAPSQSTITVTAGQRVLALNASAEVTAIVVEPSGTPVQNGTAVRFSTTLGRVDPVEVETRNGVATTTFHAGSTSGIAEVRAISGGAGNSSTSSTGGANTTTTSATNVVTFTIGAAAADTVTVRTNPSSVPASGGTVEVNAIVLGANGQGVADIPVSFSANHGTLSNIVSTSNANGVATVSLTTNVETTVTATAGSKTAATAAVVAVRGAPSVTVNCVGSTTGSGQTSCSQTVGQPVTFTIAKATASTALVSAVLTFGDGDSVTLGTLSSPVTVAHTYSSLNAYTATVTATDVNGEVTTASVAISTVRSTPSVTLNCTGSSTASGQTSCTQVVGQPFTFTVTKASTSTLLVSAVLAFGDGDSASLGTLTSAATVTHSYSSANAYTATVTATDVNGQTTTSSVAINVTARPPITVTLSADTTTSTATTAGHRVAFTAAIGTDSTALVESVSWNFGDNTTASTSGLTTAHVYTADGTYTVTATVRTQDGRSGTARTEILINIP